MEKFKYESMYKFEVGILTTGECNAFVPMAVCETSEGYHVEHKLSGFENMNFEQFENPYDMLCAIEKVARLVRDGYDYLISWDRYDCNAKNIYYKKSTEGEASMVIKFIPVEENERKEFPLIDFLDSLPQINRFVDEYVNIIKEGIIRKNLSVEGVVSLLQETKRNAFLSGWSGEK